MKKIKFFPSPHVEVRINVTDEMIADMKECKRMVEECEETETIKNCDTCSWKGIDIAPHVEVRINVTDEMIADMKECKRMVEECEETETIKNCDTCSWKGIDIDCVGMCDLKDVIRQVLEEE